MFIINIYLKTTTIETYTFDYIYFITVDFDSYIIILINIYLFYFK